jgi:hypothetical protein
MDIDRVLNVDRAATETQRQRGVSTWLYLLDFNEKCPHVDSDRFRKALTVFSTGNSPARDLKAHRENVMHAAAKLKPIVIDESLTDFENLMLARKMGYTGAALKACKMQSQEMLLASAGQKYKMFLCVQDLTCPGASRKSASLAAHVPTAAIEANSPSTCILQIRAVKAAFRASSISRMELWIPAA